MKNFKQETLDALSENGKSPKDIVWVGTDDWCISPEYFWKNCDFLYDNGYGGAEICAIYLVGEDFWLERAEYDGSEWWEFKTLPQKPERIGNPNKHFWDKDAIGRF